MTNAKCQMTNSNFMHGHRIYDLQKRTALFGENVIQFAKTIPKNQITNPLISQIIKSATSIGANYCEADDAESKNDFRHKLSIARKEARETCHWLQMLVTAEPSLKPQARILWKEARELNLIFSASIRTSRSNST